MAKLTLIDGTVFEGTTEELFEITEKYSGTKESKPAESITHNGAEYTLTKRKAQGGDVVVFTTSDRTFIKAEKPYEVNGRIQFADEDGDAIKVYHSNRRTESNTLVYAPKSKPITEGDIVVITANTNGSRNKVGDIGKAGVVRGSITKYAEVAVPQRPDGIDVNGNRTKLTEMRHATPAEIADYYQAYAEANKPKLNVGDYAVVTGVDATRKSRGAHAFNIGEIVELKSELSRGDGFNVGRLYGKSPLFQSKVDTYDLRKATEEEVAEAEAKAEQERKEAVFTKAGRKPNEYRKGDIVRTIYVEGGIRNGHEPGLIGEVTRDTIVISKKSRNPEVLIDGESLRTNVEPVTFVESRLDRN